jgi:hypothetical protein
MSLHSRMRLRRMEGRAALPMELYSVCANIWSSASRHEPQAHSHKRDYHHLPVKHHACSDPQCLALSVVQNKGHLQMAKNECRPRHKD